MPEEEITSDKGPTLVLSFWPLKNMNYSESVPYQMYEQLELGTDFNMSFGVAKYKTIQESVTLKENDNSLKIDHSSIGKIHFSKMVRKYGFFYKIVANTLGVKPPYHAFLQLKFSAKILDENLPDVSMKLSSEMNSFGYTMSSWVDGELVNLNKVCGFYSASIIPKKEVSIEVPGNIGGHS